MDLTLYALKSIAASITGLSIIMIIIIGVFFYSMNKKYCIMQKIIMGDNMYSALELTLSQLTLGIITGIAGSLILTYLGVSFNGNTQIWMLFIISIFLMFYKPRFFCFSYSVSVLGLIVIFLNYFYRNRGMETININTVSLVTFVGVMHILEGFLVMFDGDKNAIPVFTDKDGKLAGGFALKRYWPFPIVLMVLVNENHSTAVKLLSLPSWWPIIQHGTMAAVLSIAAVKMMTLYGVVGYSSSTFTMSKKQKIRLSGICTFIYGVIITFAAQIAGKNLLCEIFILILTPMAHEFMLYIQRVIENKRSKLYISDYGICILEIMRNSLAKKLGLQGGDKILSVNDEEVIDEKDLFNKLKIQNREIKLKVKKVNGHVNEIKYTLKEGQTLGIVVVPKSITVKDIVHNEKSEFQKILEKKKNKQ